MPLNMIRMKELEISKTNKPFYKVALALGRSFFVIPIPIGKKH